MNKYSEAIETIRKRSNFRFDYELKLLSELVEINKNLEAVIEKAYAETHREDDED